MYKLKSSIPTMKRFRISVTGNLDKVEGIIKKKGREDFKRNPQAVSRKTGSGSSLCLPAR